MEKKVKVMISISIGVVLFFVGNLMALNINEKLIFVIIGIAGSILFNVGFWWFIVLLPIYFYLPEILAYAHNVQKGK